MQKKQYLIAFTIFFLALIFPSAYAAPIDKIIVFGDSLSDNGNILALTMRAKKVIPGVPLIPKNPPYYEGRFSNGPNWIDDLSTSLNVPLVDYAYGGSWAEPYHDSKLVIPFSLGMQVNFYLVSSATDYHKDQHLYVIWSGNNDYVDGREDVDYATTNVVKNIQSQIDWLVYYGAKNILVLNVPDLSKVPEVLTRDEDAVMNISKLSSMHNQKLAEMLEKEKALYDDVKLIAFDVTTYFDDVIGHPEKYLLKNVNQACYGGGYYLRGLASSREAIAAKQANIDIVHNSSLRVAYETSQASFAGQMPCENPEEYFFWDRIHPTQTVHGMLATLVRGLLSENGLKGSVNKA